MSNIHILPDDLVNKIAAGEVVERPASVVKELLDNAYDSGANQITIEIEEGGTKKIYVGDNGSGMDKEDVELAFKPHATSKISSQDDLLNIKNYGFRGEALSSIASVSKVTLKSRRQSDNLGNE
ncbi:DNA mismatch repair protein MutL, partial [candidate division WWE3 bacterium CG_4_9_14_3_um_filter_34_6]